MRITIWMMMASAAILVMAGGAVPGFAGEEANPAVPATNKTVKHQDMCPVMGGAVNKNLFVDHQGKRVYVCCKGCIGTVKKNPAKYIEKLEAEGVTLDKTPQTPTTVTPHKENDEHETDEHDAHHH